MKSHTSLEKELVKPYTDYQIENLKAQFKPKAFLFKLHVSLAAIWIFTMVLNLASGKTGIAAINFLCVVCWTVSAWLNRKTANIKKKELQEMIDANNKAENQFKQEQENMASLDFFKKNVGN